MNEENQDVNVEIEDEQILAMLDAIDEAAEAMADIEAASDEAIEESNEIIAESQEIIAESETEFELESMHFDPEKQEDSLWKARTGLNENTLSGAIETIIFMSDKPLPIVKIKNLIDEDLPLRVVHDALSRLQAGYEEAHHGIRLLEVAEGYQFRTKATYAKYVQDLFKVNTLVLSPTALEVLAIIAYKQPVSKTEIEKIRGVDSSHIVRALMDKRLVRMMGRSDELGRPTLYGTTQEFLEVFNLPDLAALPSEHELESMTQSNVGKIADIKTLVHSGDKARFKFDELEELDRLSDSIKNINPETEFTKSLNQEEKKTTTEENGVKRKSAFDLLEDFVNSELITKQNRKSVLSELLSAFTDPKVISDLEAGPFNVPTGEEDEFEMIDLDTGEPLEALEDDEFDIEVELEGEEGEEALFDEDGEELENLFGEEDEEGELANALDAAFSRLTGETLSDEDLNSTELDEKEDDIEAIRKNMMERASDFDLDLDFLNNSSKSDDLPPDFTDETSND